MTSLPPALLQHARLLAHHLECRPNALRGQVVRDPQRGIVGGRLDVVLGVEPEHHVHRRRREERACHEESNQYARHLAQSYTGAEPGYYMP